MQMTCNMRHLSIHEYVYLYIYIIHVYIYMHALVCPFKSYHRLSVLYMQHLDLTI